MKLGAMALTLRQLQYVVAVDEERSFSKAAERCHVSQPALSAQISQLEESLGMAIFERSRQGVLRAPTAGPVIEKARKVLESAQDVLLAASAAQDPWQAQWRVGVIPTLSPYLIPLIAPVLGHHFPNLEVVWSEFTTEQLTRALWAGELDLGILALEADLQGLETLGLGSDEFLIAVATDHCLANQSGAATLEILRKERLLLLDDGHCLRDQALDACGLPNAQGSGFRATSLATLVEMVATGAGVTLLPRIAASTATRDGRVVLREFAPPAPYRTIGLAWRPGCPLEAAFREASSVLASAIDGAR